MIDIIQDKWLCRWSIDMSSGRQECLHEPADLALISAEDRAAIEAVNADVHTAIEAVEAYETGLRMVKVLGGDVDQPAAEILALAALRRGEATEGDIAAIAARWPGQPDITLPTPEEIARKALPALSPRQIRLVMLMIGLTDADVVAQINAMPDAGERSAALIEWQYATQIKRSHPLVETLRQQMDFTDVELDSLWAYGAAL